MDVITNRFRDKRNEWTEITKQIYDGEYTSDPKY